MYIYIYIKRERCVCVKKPVVVSFKPVLKLTRVLCVVYLDEEGRLQGGSSSNSSSTSSSSSRP